MLRWECPICLDFLGQGNLEVTLCGLFYCKSCLQALQAAPRAAAQRHSRCCGCSDAVPSAGVGGLLSVQSVLQGEHLLPWLGLQVFSSLLPQLHALALRLQRVLQLLQLPFTLCGLFIVFDCCLYCRKLLLQALHLPRQVQDLAALLCRSLAASACLSQQRICRLETRVRSARYRCCGAAGGPTPVCGITERNGAQGAGAAAYGQPRPRHASLGPGADF